jgi:penicillin amidase
LRKKIIGILICTLLIFSTTIPVIGIDNDKMNNLLSFEVEINQSENKPLTTLKADYEIIRDSYGVPHIYADTKEDFAFGMGYALAEDRLWQIDLIRRQTTGRLAEFGIATVEDDLFIRTIGNRVEEVNSVYNNFSSPYKEMHATFVDGINKYIDEAIADPDNKMPAEYIERDLLPEYITVEDSLTIGLMALRLWGEAGTGEELFRLINLVSLILKNGLRNGWKIFNDLFPIFDPDAFTTIKGDSSDIPDYMSECPPMYSPFIVKLAERIIEKIEFYNQMCESLGLIHHFGSNAWVVSPEKSTTGNTLLLGGPQMGHSIPQQVVEIGLHSPDIDAVGVTLPGLGPSLVIGVSNWCAWTQTTGGSDLVDTYIERLHPLNKYKYKFNGDWLDMEKREETIYNSTGVEYNFEICRTIHGTILGLFWVPILGGFAITRKEPDFLLANKTMEAAYSFVECKNVSEFGMNLKGIPTSHNYLVADRYGNIGYFHTGWYPIRPENGRWGRKIDCRLPLWGTGKEEWQGILPFEENPQDMNPSNGCYANWNNRPSSDWSYSEGHSLFQKGGWGENARRIQNLLDSDDDITFEDMQNICENVAYHEAVATDFLPFINEAINNIGGVPPEVESALKNWDCCYHDNDSDGLCDDPAVAIFIEWFFEMYNQTFKDEIPTSIQATLEAIGLYYRILNGDNSSLEPLYKNYLNNMTRDEQIIKALQDVLITLENRYGTNNISMWLFADWMLTPNNPIFDEIGNLKSPEKLGYHLPYMNRGTYNQITEMPNWNWSNESDYPIGANVLPCGQSGFVKYPNIISPHAYDQLDLYLNWQFKPMLFNLSSP